MVAILTGIVALIVALTSLTGSGSPHRRDTPKPVAAPRGTDAPIPAVEAGVLPWTLQSPVSREVVLAGGRGALLVAGGLTAGGSTTAAVFSIDAKTGNETTMGALIPGVHDAAGAIIKGNATVVAGGAPALTAAVQQFTAPPDAGTDDPPPPGWTTGSQLPGTAPVVITGQTTVVAAPTPIRAAQVGSLPGPRADLTAVTVGATTYVIGGYDGTNPDADILSTTEGTHYSVAGKLAVPVRYPAVAAVDGKIYIMGGEASSGAAVDTVQVFDPRNGHTEVAGRLASAVAGASAFNLQGHIYVAGGVGNAVTAPTSAPPTSAPAGAAPAVSTTPTGAVWAWDPQTGTALAAGQLPVPVAFAGSTVTYGRAWLVGGESGGVPVNTVEMVVPNARFGTAGAPGAGSPYFGYKLLIADRGNDRLLVLNPGDQLVWNYPSVFAAAPPGGFYFPDDAFFAKNGTEIISNQEENQTLVIISFPSGQVLWQYGHVLQTGSGPGYLNWPDDAYLLKDGEVTVADDRNCRVQFINPAKAVTAQIGTTGLCTHQPPGGIAEPNGDTPLADGNFLISEIRGQWISEYTRTGQLVWSTHLDMHYPSDPQQVGPDLYLVADYAISPGGAIDEFNREGQILYRLQPFSGPAQMNQPSLAEMLPTGVFMCNDDYHDRMAAFDPPTGALVWQYGVTNHAGTAPGYLNIPDGFDLLGANGSTPTHPATG